MKDGGRGKLGEGMCGVHFRSPHRPPLDADEMAFSARLNPSAEPVVNGTVNEFSMQLSQPTQSTSNPTITLFSSAPNPYLWQ